MLYVNVKLGTVPLAAIDAAALYGTVSPSGPNALNKPYSVEVSPKS